METITGFFKMRNFTISLDGEVVMSGVEGLDRLLQAGYESLQIDYPKFFKMDRMSAAGFVAAEMLLKKHAIASYQPDGIAVVIGCRNSSLDTDIRYSQASKRAPSPALFVYTLPNIVAGEICIRHGVKGENAVFISDHYNPADLGDYVHQVLLQPETRACIAGWIDVLGEEHDVFLYLVEKDSRGAALPHTTEQLNSIYH